jgi:hypothetical protein
MEKARVSCRLGHLKLQHLLCCLVGCAWRREEPGAAISGTILSMLSRVLALVAAIAQRRRVHLILFFFLILLDLLLMTF